MRLFAPHLNRVLLNNDDSKMLNEQCVQCLVWSPDVLYSLVSVVYWCSVLCVVCSIPTYLVQGVEQPGRGVTDDLERQLSPPPGP